MAEARHAAPVAWKRHLNLLLALTVCNHTQYSAGRFAVMLYALHLNASPLVIGLLLALFSLIPALTSLKMGRMLDRARNLRTPMLAACVVMALGGMLPFFWEGITALFVLCAVLGTSFNVLRISGQQMAGRYGRPEDRATSYNGLAQSVSVANLIAPLLAGFAIDHVGFSYTFLVLPMLAIPPVIVLALGLLYIPLSPAPAPGPAEESRRSAWDLLRIPGLRRILIANVALTSAWDMFTFVWPLHGSQLQYSASQIGIVAGLFFSGTFVVRVLSRFLLRIFSQWQLILISMTSASVMYVAFPFFAGFTTLAVLSFILGLLLGIMQPISMAVCYEESPPDRKGEVIGLRLTLTFSLHIIAPLVAGALGSALGLQSVWFAIAAILLAGSWVSRGQWHYRKT